MYELMFEMVIFFKLLKRYLIEMSLSYVTSILYNTTFSEIK